MADPTGPLGALGAGRGVWVDGMSYAAARIGSGAVPWANPAELGDFVGRMTGLLPSDVVWLPVGDMVAAHGDLPPAAAPARAVRAQLGANGLRERVVAITKVVDASAGQRPLVAVVPGPAHWLHAAGGSEHTSADVDRVTMFLADFVRCLGEAGVSALLLDLRTASGRDAPEPTTPDAASLKPLLNVAGHFRWPLLVRDGRSVWHVGPDGVTQVGTEVPYPSSSEALVAADPGSVALVTVPTDADPDHVQSVLGTLAR